MGAPNTSGLQNTANSLMGQQQTLFNGILGQLSPTGGGYGQIAGGLQGLLGPLGGIFGQMMSGAGAQTPGMMSQFMNLAGNPAALAAFTGINAPGMMKNATNYLGAPGQTNMAQMFPGANAQLGPGQSALGLGGGQAMDFYRGEMQNGINPQYASNAQNQLQQQFGTSVSDIMARAAPGQNTGAQMEGAQNQLLSSSANLGGQLAGMGQQFANQGAQGLVGTGQAMDANTLQRIMGQFQMAGGLDAQTMQMLTQAAQMGSGYNQQALGNIGQGVGMGLQGLSGAEGLGQLGVGMNQFGMNEMSGMGNVLGQEGFNFANMAAQEAASAPNPWSIGAQLLGGLGGAYLGGPGAKALAMPGKGGGGPNSQGPVAGGYSGGPPGGYGVPDQPPPWG